MISRVLIAALISLLCAACTGDAMKDPDPLEGLDGGADGGVDAGATPDSGTTPDAGRPDSGTPTPDGGNTAGSDAGFYGTVRCPNAQYLVCDDFETGYDTAVWSSTVQGGTLTSDGARAARGTKSIHATLASGGQKAVLSAKKTYPMEGAQLWGRMFMYVPTSAKSSLGRANFVTAYGTNASGGGAVFGTATGGTGTFFSLFFQVSPQIDESSYLLHPAPYTAVPLDRWFCFEWEFSHKDKRLRQFLDGALIPTTVMENREAPKTAAFSIGPEYGINDVWIDSVAIATTRIFCDG